MVGLARARATGGNKHAKEISDYWHAYARCQTVHKLKCENCPPSTPAPGVPVPLPEWTPAPEAAPVPAPAPEFQSPEFLFRFPIEVF